MKYFAHFVLHSEMKAMHRVEARQTLSFAERLHLCTKPKLASSSLPRACSASKQADPAIPAAPGKLVKIAQ
jgi:hypothetical protein